MKKSIISVLSVLTGAAAGAAAAGKLSADKRDEAKAYANKCIDLFQMMNKWVRVKQEGKNLSSYFEKEGYKKIAIYGMSYVGETLLEELKDTDIQVAYGIDQRAEDIYADLEVFSVDDDFDEVDAIVVTAITFFAEIEEKLADKVSCPVISLEDVIHEV